MKKIKKMFYVMLSLMMMLGVFCMSASAAASRKCYTISDRNTTVYSNTALTRRLGSIYGSDEIKVLNVTSRYSKVQYPISRRRTKT